MIAVTNKNSRIIYLVRDNDQVIAVPADGMELDAKQGTLEKSGYQVNQRWLSTGMLDQFFALIAPRKGS